MTMTPITFTALDHPTIRHGFFGRQGGVSGGEYASLNVGLGSGDNLDDVRENRKHVASSLGSAHGDMLTCYQIHSATCHIVTNMDDTKLEGDALVTNTPGLVISVLTADCVPVLFADHTAGVIGAAHAGWKGALGGVIENTIQAMEQLGAQKSNIVAAIGPAIAQASYEVGSELKAQFCDADQMFADFFKVGKDDYHWQFDLPGLACERAHRLGIAKVEKLDYDTYANEERFFSFRRSTHATQSEYGRQCSAIMLV